MRRRTWGSVSVFLLFLPIMVGCNNIWEWTADSESFEALLSEGRQAIQASDYPTAEAAFTEAVNMRPDDAEARYYLAKAAVLNGGVDVYTLVQSLTEDSHGAESIFGFDMPTANSVYRVNRVVLDNLLPIRNGGVRQSEFANVDVDLDLVVAYALSGILRLRDTNGDGVINEDDVSIDDIGISVDDDGNWTFEGADNVGPDDINGMIDGLGDLLGDGGDVLDALVGDDVGIDTDDLQELIDNLEGDLAYYYVNTLVPGNPGEGDNDGDGTADEECLNGIDDDGDGLTDEDSRVCQP